MTVSFKAKKGFFGVEVKGWGDRISAKQYKTFNLLEQKHILAKFFPGLLMANSSGTKFVMFHENKLFNSFKKGYLGLN